MKWISVKDELPHEYDYVLVCTQMPGSGEPCPISIGRYFNEKWECFREAYVKGDIAWEIDPEDVTHWMPSPKPPKD